MEHNTKWEIYFAGIASIQYHPANPKETRMSLEECAKVADEMVEITNKRQSENIKELKTCHGP